MEVDSQRQATLREIAFDMLVFQGVLQPNGPETTWQGQGE
jgi:hypothetical protein